MLNDDLITHLFNWFRFWVEKPVQIVVQSNHHTCIGCFVVYQSGYWRKESCTLMQGLILPRVERSH